MKLSLCASYVGEAEGIVTGGRRGTESLGNTLCKTQARFALVISLQLSVRFD